MATGLVDTGGISMTDKGKIRKFLKKADYSKITEYSNGFKVTIPGDEQYIDLFVIVKDSTFSLRGEGLKITSGDMTKLFEHLLRLNNTSLLAKWGINENGAIFVGHDRLLKDLDFSEFYAATQLVVNSFEEHMDGLKKFI